MKHGLPILVFFQLLAFQSMAQQLGMKGIDDQYGRILIG